MSVLFVNNTASPEFYTYLTTLPRPDALPSWPVHRERPCLARAVGHLAVPGAGGDLHRRGAVAPAADGLDHEVLADPRDRRDLGILVHHRAGPYGGAGEGRSHQPRIGMPVVRRQRPRHHLRREIREAVAQRVAADDLQLEAGVEDVAGLR